MTSVAFSEEGSCEEEDFDLFKAFLRDSDSDCEDAYYIQPSCASRASFDSGKSCVLQDDLSPLGKGGKHDLGFGLMSPSCRANSSSLLNLSSKLDACTTPESGSPHSSQGHSSLTSFPSMVSEHGSQEREDQSTFHSMLSMTSTSTLFDFESPDDSPDRKRKANWVVMGHPEKKSSSPAESVSSAAAEKCPTPPPALAPLAASKPCCPGVGMGQGLPAISAAPGSFVGGSISTGVPIDTLSASPPAPLPFARSPPPVATYPAAWPTYLAPLPGKGMGVIQPPLQSPQAMIPTAPPAMTHYLPPARPAPTPTAPSAISTQKIAAALAEMSKLPVGAGPLGLKLDRASMTHTLRGMGVKKLEA